MAVSLIVRRCYEDRTQGVLDSSIPLLSTTKLNAPGAASVLRTSSHCSGRGSSHACVLSLTHRGRVRPPKASVSVFSPNVETVEGAHPLQSGILFH